VVTSGAAATLTRLDGRLALRDAKDGIRWSVQCASENGENYKVTRLDDGEAYYVASGCVYALGRSRLQLVPLGPSRT
jgi:hypothetical protein